MVLAPLVEQKQKYKNLSVQRGKEIYNEKTLLVHTYTNTHTHTHIIIIHKASGDDDWAHTYPLEAYRIPCTTYRTHYYY